MIEGVRKGMRNRPSGPTSKRTRGPDMICIEERLWDATLESISPFT
jgi:hypothetical protein